ncbi:hypothetical protein SPRG_00490 [Saprolegnia parasitica CBS 223.65]|uniref:Cilia- and flagella-associated protein 52 n=1 Tax=Saprolegnia parasitica (strain CBS 223.65) TaxID=695850 RepID=A0A067CYB7_SAPPC|nr:hypothetical protein SPRG_00490 [Saprolegnia parasitica CBS 223.65]KDO35669.1 hypothetical protein SPRG_00490 [Saprolegnia parasitica CBS 223.65]|eukprot:XP_012193974.1 hypothetical protein SPRG_00490 [Saprolegnia parasitica CBS 223.65]
MAEVAELKLFKVIGYNGSYNNTVIYTKDGQYLIYSLGLTVVIKDLRSSAQGFLHGHTDIITCLAISNDGAKLASGQQSKSRGNKAPVLVWDLRGAIAAMTEKANQSDKVIYRLVLHMGKVQDMAFSSQDTSLYTVGGQDDNALVCWSMKTGEPVCGTPAGDDSTLVVTAFRQGANNDLLVTGGNYSINVWRIDHKYRKFHPLRANLGNLKRIISTIALSSDDKIAYCGTKTGDLLEVIMDCDLTKPNCAFPPVGAQKPRYNRTTKERFSQGINTVIVYEDHGHRYLLLGAGDGSLAILPTGGINEPIKSTPIVTTVIEKLLGGITSLSEGPHGSLYAGTNQSNMYSVAVTNTDGLGLRVDLRATCHYGGINDIVFPKSSLKSHEMNSNLFVTCSKTDIRIWNARRAQEILRIQVPNLVCNCIDLTSDGSVIVSGWDDGKVRAFYPESGKLKFVIQDAHNESVTAIAVCHDTEQEREWRLITGGKDGRVRVWRITPSRQTMEASMKEHRGPVNSIQIVRDNSSCVSASSDGSCISWNLENYTRVQAMFASTVFRRILYHPDESQLLTCGSDRRITYYDSYDGEAIRILEEAADGEMLALDIERSGNIFVTGGRDSTLKVWHYDNGEPIAVGKGHSEAINAVKISPERQHIVTVGSEGAIMIWEMGSLLNHLTDDATE